jgi:uncharacterized membrane protein YhhN
MIGRETNNPIVGLILFVAGLVLFILGLSSGGSLYPWTDARVIAWIVIGAVLIIAFLGMCSFEMFIGAKH